MTDAEVQNLVRCVRLGIGCFRFSFGSRRQ